MLQHRGCKPRAETAEIPSRPAAAAARARRRRGVEGLNTLQAGSARGTGRARGRDADRSVENLPANRIMPAHLARPRLAGGARLGVEQPPLCLAKASQHAR